MMPKANDLPPGKALLVIAHPGHELRVHHWCELARPDVAVLTDGSGSKASSRLHRTTELLNQFDAMPTEFYAPVTDLALYEAVLERDDVWLTDLALRLTRILIGGEYDYVVGDAPEGAIMGHDVLRGLLDPAIALARRVTNRPIANYDFPLEAVPGVVHPSLQERCIELKLDEAALDRKIVSALGYLELADEVVKALEVYGRDAFALECLRPALTEADIKPFEGKPEYERHGERQVADGRYAAVARYEEHVAPTLQKVQSRVLETEWVASKAAV